MAKSLFVGNLPWTTTEEELKQKFGEHVKVVAARVVTDKFSGKSRGFGFVEVDDADAEKAISAMNGQKFGDREIIVNEARPKREGGGGERRGGRPGRDF